MPVYKQTCFYPQIASVLHCECCLYASEWLNQNNKKKQSTLRYIYAHTYTGCLKRKALQLWMLK
jgi:hypothetical protein